MVETAQERPVASEVSVPARTQPRPAILREILFPSDLSSRSDRAFDHGRFLAETFGARLVLYHAIEIPRPEDAPRPWVLEQEIFRRKRQAALEHLEGRADTLAVGHRIVLEPAESAPRSLAKYIRAHPPDLIVMATHGREGLPRLFVGSVTEKVLEQGLGPVLCVREPDHGVALPYRRILVPTDLSQPSRRAFPLAALLARTFDAQVLAVHVARRPRASSLSGVPDLIERSVPSESSVSEFLQPEFAGVRLRSRVDVGSPWDCIIELAKTEKTDVIVMSTHGHDSLADRVIGSHTERVVRHAPCPVLVA